MMLEQWKAYVSIGDGPRIPLSIVKDEIRGLVAREQIDLSKLSLKLGPNPIRVDFESSSDDGKKHSIALRSQLTVTP